MSDQHAASITSPVMPGGRVRLVRHIPTGPIHQHYQSLGVDTDRYFKALPVMDLLECEQTGYQFYHPYSVMGDGRYYSDMSRNEAYYDPWRWEHQQAFDLIPADSKVLEIGAGFGDFLKRLQTKLQHRATGIELNPRSVEEGARHGVSIVTETIEEHAGANKERYDVVCNFQVMEHIWDVHSFLSHSLEVLRPGGTMIIAVPNNRSYFNINDDGVTNYLNYPPHHMGRWTADSLSKLSDSFPMRMDRLLFQPVNDAERGFIVYNQLIKWPGGKLLYKLFQKTGIFSLLKQRVDTEKWKAHTVMCVFTKE